MEIALQWQQITGTSNNLRDCFVRSDRALRERCATPAVAQASSTNGSIAPNPACRHGQSVVSAACMCAVARPCTTVAPACPGVRSRAIS
jgi:hypothetical protein